MSVRVLLNSLNELRQNYKMRCFIEENIGL